MTELTRVLLVAASSFVLYLAVFSPLEWAFPARKDQRFLRPDLLTDLCYFAGQFLLWAGLVTWMLDSASVQIHWLVPETFRSAVARQPWLLHVVEVVILSDFTIYWAHRLQHSVPLLWRFHRVHHSTEHLDWVAAYREHPFDSIYTLTLVNLPAYLLGFPVGTLAAFLAFRGLWAVYLHSNVRLPIGPLRWFIGAPELHHWHHHKSRDAGNYANMSPIMDIIFGTYHCPDHEPDSLGVDTPTPRGYLAQLAQPFLPTRSDDSVPKTEATPAPAARLLP